MYEYLLGVGAMKAGTTLLYDLLRTHPRICHGKAKELHYFDQADKADKADYDALFTQGQGLKMDITPIYMYDKTCLDKICSVIDPKKAAVVAILRDPVERALSHYNMRLSQDLEKRTLEECFRQKTLPEHQDPHDRRILGYFARGLYARQLDDLYAHFPRENVKILLFEDLIKDQQGAVDQVCAFLGLEPITVKATQSNKSVVHVKSQGLAKLMRTLARLTPNSLKGDGLRRLKYLVMNLNEKKGIKDRIDPALRKEMTDYYREDAARLAKEYGIDISKWKNFR